MVVATTIGVAAVVVAAAAVAGFLLKAEMRMHRNMIHTIQKSKVIII